MDITIYCGKCGKKLTADSKMAGKETECTRCNTKIPVPSGDFDQPQIRMYCLGCGARVRAEVDQSGGDMRCPKCKQLIPLPIIEGDRAAKAKAPGKKGAAVPRPKKRAGADLELAPDIEKELAKMQVKREGRRPPRPSPDARQDREGRPKPWELTRDVTAEVAPIDLDVAGRRNTMLAVVALVIAVVIIMFCAWFFVLRKGTTSKSSSSSRPAKTAPARGKRSPGRR